MCFLSGPVTQYKRTFLAAVVSLAVTLFLTGGLALAFYGWDTFDPGYDRQWFSLKTQTYARRSELAPVLERCGYKRALRPVVDAMSTTFDEKKVVPPHDKNNREQVRKYFEQVKRRSDEIISKSRRMKSIWNSRKSTIKAARECLRVGEFISSGSEIARQHLRH